MKSSLWSVIALVCAIVGFLMGYSVSAYTGSKASAALRSGHPEPAAAAHATSPVVPAGAQAPAAAPAPEAGGYGVPAASPPAAPKAATPAAGY